MKRRDVFIAALVLVPFAVLVVLGSPSPCESGERVGVRGPFETQPSPSLAPDAATLTKQPLTPALSPPSQGEGGHPSVTVELISRVERTCLADQKRARAVEVRFTPTRDGGFVGVEAQTQDPWLAACVTDVFEETPWQPSPSGTESFAPQIFSFGRPTE